MGNRLTNRREYVTELVTKLYFTPNIMVFNVWWLLWHTVWPTQFRYYLGWRFPRKNKGNCGNFLFFIICGRRNLETRYERWPPPEILCTRLNLIIWVFTKMGIDLNDKLEIFSKKLTMMGCHYFPRNDILLPKEWNLYKLLLISTEIIKKKSCLLSDVKKFSGKFNWLERENRHGL